MIPVRAFVQRHVRRLFACLFTASAVVRAVHVVSVQGFVSHAMHWLRSLSTAVHVGRMADHRQYADRSNVLCPLCWTFDVIGADFRYVKENLH
jgi:alkyl hydroperoxide reductase subunit AhpC